MNEFTKEELEIAKDGVGWMISECEMLHNKAIVNNWRCVESKLQLMIENYCEHEYKKTLDKSGMFFINMCHKCYDQKPCSKEND
jgi:hypothetical protein